MPDRRNENRREAEQHQDGLAGGYEGAGPGYGRGYGRDFGGGGRNQGFDGSWGQGYDASTEQGDDRSWFDLCADDECLGRRHHRGRGPKGWSRDDQRVYEEVCERLLRDRLIDARGMEVEVEDGVVTLRGQARAAADPQLAARLVRETPGVKGVELLLQVRGEPGGRRYFQEADEAPGVDKSAVTPPIVPGRAPPPDPAGAP